MSWINDVTQYSDSQHQKKNIFLTDAIFQAAGYAAMTQADSNQKNYVNEQNLRPSIIWLQNVYSIKIKNVHLHQAILGNKIGI